MMGDEPEQQQELKEQDLPHLPKKLSLSDYLNKTDLSNPTNLNSFIKENHIIRWDHESEQEFAKRVKKINYLNLAQQLICNNTKKVVHHSSAFPSQANSQIQNADVRDSDQQYVSTFLNNNDSAVKRMKPLYDYDEADEQPDNYDEEEQEETSSDSEDEYIPRRKSNFANDIKQKLHNLAAEVQRTFGTSTSDDDRFLESNDAKSKNQISNKNTVQNRHHVYTTDDHLADNFFIPKVEKIEPTVDENDVSSQLFYTNESLLPQVDWENLEKQLKQAQVERERYDKARLNDRDEIRRKLAMGNESENEDDFYTSDYIKKSLTSSHRIQGSNLQICFMNEPTSDNDCGPDSEIINGHERKYHQIQSRLRKNLKQKVNDNSDQSSVNDTENVDNDNILTKQKRLKEEAKMALALIHPMAKMQVEIERRKREKKKSPIFDIIGIHNYDEKSFTPHMLEDMNIGQLQVIVNDLHCQIENHNDILIPLLIERDELHMAQDSILVDIEDLTKRLQEYAANITFGATIHSDNSKPNPQRVFIIKQDTNKEKKKSSLLHRLLRKATVI
ncbi:unnamed protein product [Didymodactylos carnosus]|uniref:Schwannomin interacting protein 1 C-terminal domain-containing protein n=2 Tax=Didymodactylos carnosus TaxID=1234261 RepID=A0A813ST06_9BILA|nr:unnamed protein product [Didymodactylos carnosus]CAF3590156.1 unnamed protein product [Didymodactylos carnosus]